MVGGSGFEGGRGDREGERVNEGSHISSILIFHDISPYCCLQIICHPPFYALRLLVRSILLCHSFCRFLQRTRCTKDSIVTMTMTHGSIVSAY